MAWWQIDPNSGQPVETGTAETAPPLLSDEVLEAGFIADAMDAEFAISRYTQAELRNLLFHRIVPRAVAPFAEPTAALLQDVDDFWTYVDDLYQKALKRSATEIERKFIFVHIFGAMKPA